ALRYRGAPTREGKTAYGGPRAGRENARAAARPAEVEQAALRVRRLGSQPEVVEEAPEGRQHRRGVGGAQARDVEEDEDGERDEERGGADEHLERDGQQSQDEQVIGPLDRRPH